MSKKERIKLEIDILKALILAFLTAIFGIFGYSVINYQSIDLVKAVAIMLGIMVLCILLYICAKKVLKNLKDIEELQ
ncbi:hypothetical protein DMB92_02675 [Campylobacter sp. MIT 99-7217]|uniref:hypothetical protein n=1 Tax=Campylobacter sp. MIT 99-7217 TaxID=535091 RepID=UPI0011581BFB|nr:hypothetical protein [Campylobacter sp. MIT 99-7217]TQR33806.1 hypothetical protein DMB92_02675 [Campylobacter sp. MIT 99-7217]